MKRNNSNTTWRLILLALAVVPLIFWSIGSKAQKPGSKAAANLDQIRNGTESSPLNPPTWVNGNAGKSNAHYREGDSIAYRLVITGLKPNSDHNVQIEWDITHSSVNAIDYITHYDRSTPTVQPCLGVSGCNAASFDTAPIPAPASNNSPVGTQPIPSFNALPAGQKLITIYNGTIADDGSGLAYLSPQGNLSSAQASTGMQINFHANSATVVISWGGHIGSRLDWGFDPGTGKPRSAGGISGSPYHTRLLSLDGSGGNQDRSLSADAVLPPAACLISGPQSVCSGQTGVSYSGPAGNDTYTWTLTGNATFSNGTQSATGQTVNVVAGAAGTYDLSLVVTKAGSSQNSCPFTATVNPVPVVQIVLGPSDPACDSTATLSANITSGGDPSDTYLWSGPSNNGATSSSITPTVPGEYSVTVTGPGGCSGSDTRTLCFTLQ